MSDAAEQNLNANIDHLYQQFDARFAKILVPPGDKGYSAQVLTSVVALVVEFEDRFTALKPFAQNFDTAQPGPVSQRLAALITDLRKKLKEWSYMAAFKVTYESFDAYIAALPTTVPSGANLQLLTSSLDQLNEFEKAFHSFEPRAEELAAQGLLPWMQEKWLSPLILLAQQQIGAMKKRCDAARGGQILFQSAAVNQAPVTTPAQQYIDEFNNSCRAMNAAIGPLNAQIAAANGNIWADPTPLFNAIYDHYQVFLRRIAPIEPRANELAAQGQPQLLQSLQAWKTDIENASKIVKQIVAERQATNMGVLKIGSGIQSDWERHHETMYKAQQGITAAINSYRP